MTWNCWHAYISIYKLWFISCFNELMWFLAIKATIETPHFCHLAAKFWTWVNVMRFHGQKVFIANVDLNLIHFHESSFLLKVTQIDSFSRHVSCSTNYSWPISAWKWGAPSEVDFYWTVHCGDCSSLTITQGSNPQSSPPSPSHCHNTALPNLSSQKISK